MSEPCEFDCRTRGKHTTNCTCTTDCEEHNGHCAGCFPRPTGDNTGHWCQWHYDRTHSALYRLADLVTMLAFSSGGKIASRTKDGSDHTRRATQVDQLSPSPAADLADEAARWAAAWAEVAADYAGHYGPFAYTTGGILVPQLHRHLGYLAVQLPTIAGAPYSKDFATEAHGLTRTVELATGQDRLMHRLKARCPSCNQISLVREDGAERVDCRNSDCARVWSSAEYANLAHVAAS